MTRWRRRRRRKRAVRGPTDGEKECRVQNLGARKEQSHIVVVAIELPSRGARAFDMGIERLKFQNRQILD